MVITHPASPLLTGFDIVSLTLTHQLSSVIQKCSGSLPQAYLTAVSSTDTCFIINKQRLNLIAVMESPSLGDLPTEILEIFSGISSRKTLRNLTLCSRRIHAVATPHLYQHVSLYTRQSKTGDMTVPGIRPPAALLLQRPDIASSVQHFSILKAQTHIVSEPETEACLRGPGDASGSQDPAQARLFDRIAEATPSSETEDWLRQLKPERYDDAILGHLLLCLPNLKILDLHIQGMASGVIEELLHRTIEGVARQGKQLDAFKSLEHVMLGANDCGKGLTPTLFACLLRLPSVRRICCEGMDSSTNPVDECSTILSRLPSRSSGVKRVEIANSIIQTNTPHILRICQGLTTFTYHIGTEQTLYQYSGDFSAMQAAINPHQGTLETLWLGDVQFLYNQLDLDFFRKTFPGFRAFSKLKRLGLSMDYVGEYMEGLATIDRRAGHWERGCAHPSRARFEEFFPPGLEVLSILRIAPYRRFDKLILAALADSIQGGALASLQALRLECRASVLQRRRSILRDLSHVCIARGVGFVLIECEGLFTAPRYPTQSNPPDAADLGLWAVDAEDVARELAERSGVRLVDPEMLMLVENAMAHSRNEKEAEK